MGSREAVVRLLLRVLTVLTLGLASFGVAAADGGAAAGGAASAKGAEKAGDGGAASAKGAAQTGAERPAADAAVELGKVLQKLSRTAALSARFREEKRMSLLAQPLVSEGSLHYEKPRRLARHTERPRAGSMLLRDDVLTFGDAQRSESIGLSSQPALRVLVDTFVSVLAGDRAALERAAHVTVESLADGGFRIRMVPRDAGVKRLVRTMAFEGKGAVLSRMELIDASGDTTITTFHDVKLRERFSESERARLFRIGG